MKKLLFMLTMLITLVACNPDETTSSTQLKTALQTSCNCGTIIEAAYQQSYNITTIKIQNDCTGKIIEKDQKGKYKFLDKICDY
jgi:hypothetical protein